MICSSTLLQRDEQTEYEFLFGSSTLKLNTILLLSVLREGVSCVASATVRRGRRNHHPISQCVNVLTFNDELINGDDVNATAPNNKKSKREKTEKNEKQKRHTLDLCAVARQCKMAVIVVDSPCPDDKTNNELSHTARCIFCI